MKNLMFIFIGGGFGSVLRFLVSAYTHKLWKVNAFPAGTFLVNIIGCLLMGLFISAFTRSDSDLKWLLITGFCGGFTTFSAFSSENVLLWQSGNYFVMMLYILLSVIAGFAAMYAGLGIARL